MDTSVAKLKKLGHDARLMLVKYVHPYSTGQKDDFRDAEPIAEAVQGHTMKVVAPRPPRAVGPSGAPSGAGAAR